MRIVKKTICTLAALCLFGATPPSGASLSAKAESMPPELYSFSEILPPIWEGDTSYMETVLPVENEYGGIDPIQLLYPIEEILEVKNATLTKTYQKGVDYAVAGGKLIIAEDGNIPTLSYAEFHPTQGQAGFESTEGGYMCFHEGDWFHQKQIVVTYKHTAKYDGYIPEGKATLLPKVKKKLQKGEDFDLLVFGDSISVGANSSGFVGASPFMPSYAKLFEMQLESAYDCQVNCVNPSVGGKDIDWGLSEIDGILAAQKNVDLAVLAFGMNDGRKTPDEFANKALQLAQKVQEAFPEAEVMLVATMLPNPQAKNFSLNQGLFYDALYEKCEREGVAVVNMTGMHASLLKKKRYADMTGNNVNHPNDYLARVYAQTLFATLTDRVIQSPCDGVVNDENDGGKQMGASFFGLLTAGCNGVASISACIAAVAIAACILKTKKDD